MLDTTLAREYWFVTETGLSRRYMSHLVQMGFGPANLERLTHEPSAPLTELKKKAELFWNYSEYERAFLMQVNEDAQGVVYGLKDLQPDNEEEVLRRQTNIETVNAWAGMIKSEALADNIRMDEIRRMVCEIFVLIHPQAEEAHWRKQFDVNKK